MASVTASWRFVDTRPQPRTMIIDLKLAESLMRDERDEVVPKAVRQKQRGAVRS
jgi:hypothetical protein